MAIGNMIDEATRARISKAMADALVPPSSGNKQISQQPVQQEVQESIQQTQSQPENVQIPEEIKNAVFSSINAGSSNFIKPQSSFAESGPKLPDEQVVPGDGENRKSKLLQVLARLGVPLGAAIAGTVSESALPAAAGLASGFNTGFEGEEEKPIFTVGKDEEGNPTLVSLGNIGAKGQVISSSDKSDLLSQLIGQGGLNFNIPKGDIGDAVKSVEQKTKDIQDGDKTLSFKSVSDAEDANLPKGTIVDIGGRKARIK